MPILAPSASDVTASVKAGAEVNAAIGGAVAKGGNSAPPRAGGTAAAAAAVTQSKAAQTSTITTSFRNANVTFIPRGPRVWVWSSSKFLSTGLYGASLAGNYDGGRILAQRTNGALYLTINGGVSWVNNTSIGTISGVSKLSRDGMIVLTTQRDSTVRISSNGGFNFTDITPPSVLPYWAGIAMSSDGTKLALCNNPADGYVYTATRSGSTWTFVAQPGAGQRAWTWIVGSSDGNTLIAAAGGNSYKSTDGGVTWSTARPMGGAANITDVQCSEDTNILFGRHSTTLYRSVDGGITWSVTGPPPGPIWRSCSMSANGLKMLGVSPSQTWLSETSGTIWTLQPSIGGQDLRGGYISGDGNTIAVAGYSEGKVWFAANE